MDSKYVPPARFGVSMFSMGQVLAYEIALQGKIRALLAEQVSQLLNEWLLG